MPQKNKRSPENDSANLKWQQPESPKEARDWLEDAARHLSGEPIKDGEYRVNPSTRRRFVGRALLQYLQGDLKGEQSLRHALCLVTSKGAKRNRGNQPVPDDKIREISKMLCEKATVPEIVKAVGLSKETVHAVRADMNALDMKWPLSQIDVGEELPAIEAADAKARMSIITKSRTSAIIKGMVDATTADEFFPED